MYTSYFVTYLFKLKQFIRAINNNGFGETTHTSRVLLHAMFVEFLNFPWVHPECGVVVITSAKGTI